METGMVLCYSDDSQSVVGVPSTSRLTHVPVLEVCLGRSLYDQTAGNSASGTEWPGDYPVSHSPDGRSSGCRNAFLKAMISESKYCNW